MPFHVNFIITELIRTWLFNNSCKYLLFFRYIIAYKNHFPFPFPFSLLILNLQNLNMKRFFVCNYNNRIFQRFILIKITLFWSLLYWYEPFILWAYILFAEQWCVKYQVHIKWLMSENAQTLDLLCSAE